jgi:hypothetical protein
VHTDPTAVAHVRRTKEAVGLTLYQVLLDTSGNSLTIARISSST